jgi:hypothetical protein
VVAALAASAEDPTCRKNCGYWPVNQISRQRGQSIVLFGYAVLNGHVLTFDVTGLA